MSLLEIEGLVEKTDEECVALATDENGVLDAENLMLILLDKYIQIEQLTDNQH